MRIVCPCCQTDFPVEAGINDVNARAAVKLAFSITPFGDALLAYVQLFKPEKKVLSMTKLTKLLEELVPMMRDGKIELNGRTWSAPQPYWQQAITYMLDTRSKLRLPLKNHNYLFQIIISYADRAEGERESQTEARKQGGVTRKLPEKQKTSAMPEQVRGQLNQFLNKTITN